MGITTYDSFVPLFFRFHVLVMLYDVHPSLTSLSIIILKSFYVAANSIKNYLKNDTYELIYKKETNSDFKTKPMVIKGEGAGRDTLEVLD